MRFQNRNWELDRLQIIGPQVLRILRERIVYGDLKPGQKITETGIAGDFETSRQPVREAFMKLAGEGLLEVKSQRGTYIRKIAMKSVMDIRFVREAIEADIVKLLAAQANARLTDELFGQIELQKKIDKENYNEFHQLDEKFHWMLAEAAGKTYAWNVVANVKSQMDRVRYLSARDFAFDKLIDQHEAIIVGIADADATAAEKAMRGHLQEVLIDMPLIAKERPEFFEIDRDEP